MRICRTCNNEKPLTKENFPQRENGLFRYQCRVCLNEAVASRMAVKLKDKRTERASKLDEAKELFLKGYKVCSSCAQSCVVSQFNKQTLGLFGLESHCRNCKQRAKDSRFGTKIPLRKCRKCNKEGWDVSELDLFAKAGGSNKFGRYNLCKECHTSSDNSIKHNNSLEKRVKKFGITVTQYEDMIISQNNSCAICKKHKDDFTGRGKNFHIDHCHTSGKVRGLLCSNCNTGLGQFKDNVQYLENAIQYVIETK